MIRSPLLLLILLLSGCARTLMPTPNLYVNGVPFPEVPESRRSSVVEIIYATDRAVKDEGDGDRVTYDALRSESLAVGLARVRIGRENTTWEQLETLSASGERRSALPVNYVEARELIRFPRTPWFLNLADDPDLTEAAFERQLTPFVEQFHELLAEQLAVSEQKDVYIFVHGFNNTFGYAAETLAQLWHFMGRPGVAISYSWPAARAGIWGYNPDRESGEFTVTHLKRFLRMVADCEEVANVNLLAHSRGCDIAATAVRELGLADRAAGLVPAETLKLRNVALVAADIDGQVAVQRLAGEKVIESTRRMTLYSAKDDTALSFASDMFMSAIRLGATAPETVSDTGKIIMLRHPSRFATVYLPRKTGFTGHGYLIGDRRVSSDLILLLRDDLDPGPANGRPLVQDESGLWLAEEGYPRFDYSAPASSIPAPVRATQ